MMNKKNIMICIFIILITNTYFSQKNYDFCDCPLKSDSTLFDEKVVNELKRNILSNGIKNKLLIESKKIDFNSLNSAKIKVIVNFNSIGEYQDCIFIQSKYSKDNDSLSLKIDNLFSMIPKYNNLYFNSSGELKYLKSVLVGLTFDEKSALIEINSYNIDEKSITN